MSESPVYELLTVYDQPSRCPYLPDRDSRMPLCFPSLRIEPLWLDQLLEDGYRRSGQFVYRPQCSGCRECRPIRVLVDQFEPTRSQRRAWVRGERELQTRLTRPQVDPQRIELFNRHRMRPHLSRENTEIEELGYRQFLVESCTRTVEWSYWLDSELIGVAICDQGAAAWSAHYCFFDPEYSRWSPGVYSILKQIAEARAAQVQYLYLGFYVADCPAMSYKQLYRPHERWLDDHWQRFD